MKLRIWMQNITYLSQDSVFEGLVESSNLTPLGSPKKVQKNSPESSTNSPLIRDEPKTENMCGALDTDNAILGPKTILTPSHGTTHDITAEDKISLCSLFGEETKNNILRLYENVLEKPFAKPKQLGSVLTPPVNDRQLRSQMHQALRRIFQNRLESSFDEVSKGIRILAVSMKSRQGSERIENPRRDKNSKGKLEWNERGGEYLHMTLCKQDRDTMEVISYIARFLKVKPRNFSFAGTKDRRAVTTQRVSAYRLTAETVAKVNDKIHNAAVGDFKYEKCSLELGELKGNSFTITLRECHLPEDDQVTVNQRFEKVEKAVDLRCNALALSGFINYYGLQRFGTFEIGTHIIGKLILQGNYDQAVACILSSSSDTSYLATQGNDFSTCDKQIGKDELDRARAIKGFILGEIKLDEALLILPRRFSAERNILQHLKSRKGNDYLGALLNIPRNLRLMYVHAYQSYIWNEIASERWARYGNKVVTGDLVLISRKNNGPSHDALFDECGEIIVRPAAHDASVALDSMFERARALSSGEVEGGEFTLSDIVLPLPGFDIEYPANDIGQAYKILMGGEKGGGLDPMNMRRKQKDFSLSGSYRKLMASADSLSFTTKIYHDENEKLVATDMDKILEKRVMNNSNNIVIANISSAENHVLNATGSMVDEFKRPTSHSSGSFPQKTFHRISNQGTDERILNPEYSLDKNACKTMDEEKFVVNKEHTTIDTFYSESPILQESSQHISSTYVIPQDNTTHSSKETIYKNKIDTSVAHSHDDLIATSRPLDDSNLTTDLSEMAKPPTISENLVPDHTSTLPPLSRSTTSCFVRCPSGEETFQPTEKMTIVNKSNFVSNSSMQSSSASSSYGVESSDHQGLDMKVNCSTFNPRSEPVIDESLVEAKLGVVLKFNLLSSQYATMLLRELMGANNVKHYQPHFGVSKQSLI